MSWDSSYGGGWGQDSMNSAPLQSPNYDLGEQRFGAIPGVDPYYASAQSISVPAVPGSMNIPTSLGTTPAERKHSSLLFQTTGVVQGIDPTRWVNKETATLCKLCEAPFSTLKKRRV
jgi:hypothetical protein